MLRRVATLLVVLAALAAGCSGDDPGETLPRADDSETPSPTPEPDLASPPPTSEATPAPTPNGGEIVPIEQGDRIVVERADGSLATMRPDGSDVAELTPPGRAAIHTQPTWSLDGSRIAWTRIETGTGQTFIESSRADRSAPVEIPVLSAPFYYSWDPSSQRLAYLAAGVNGIDLGIADIATEPSAAPIDSGAPYYFSWGPEGDELFVHVAGFRLDKLKLDGNSVVLEELPASFQAPVWSDGDRQLIFADQVDGNSSLVATGIDGEGRFPLADFDGYLTMAVNADASRVAFLVFDEPLNDDPGIITASGPSDRSTGRVTTAAISQDELFEIPEIETGILYVTPTFAESPFALTEADQEVLGFFWSPAGDRLAILLVDPDTDLAEWWFWEINTAVPFRSGHQFTPSRTFTESYLPFFDQYGQSHTFFSPDGTELVYAGTDPDGIDGIWVQPAIGGQPRRIADDGVFAAWSPGAAGSAGANAP